jgi:hypothetical protein
MMKSNVFNDLSYDILLNYIFTWVVIALDVCIKLAIALGHPLLFDSIITILSVTLRSRVNLRYGLELKNLVRKYANEDMLPRDDNSGKYFCLLFFVSVISP